MKEYYITFAFLIFIVIVPIAILFYSSAKENAEGSNYSKNDQPPFSHSNNNGRQAHRNTYRTSPTQNNSKEPYSYTTSVGIAEGAIRALEKRGLRDYLFKEFHYTGKNIIPQNEDFEQTIRSAFLQVVMYLSLPPFVHLEIEYANDPNNKKKAYAGLYTTNGSDHKVTINIRNNYNHFSILAIICHECTHYFMQYHHLNWNDTSMNEQRTDVLACMLGFSSILESGYRPNPNIDPNDVRTYDTYHTIGYIPFTECQNIRSYIEEYRKNNRSSTQNKDACTIALPQLIRKGNNLIGVARYLDVQLSQLDIPRDINIISTESFYKALSEYKTTNTTKEIDCCETIIKESTDVTQLQNAIKHLEELCDQMLKWSNAFQGRFFNND